MIRAFLLSLVLLAAAPADLRVLEARSGKEADLATVFDAAARADLVFVGERHDDEAAHRFQLALLQALAERGRPVALVLEMFERDVQPALDDYLAGRIDEAEMLGRTRPWPNYAAAYRPLVELARARGWPVVAGNAPRALASRIAREGLGVLETLPAAERLQVAAAVRCGDGPYREKFMAEMRRTPAHGANGALADFDRLFESQCAKDETMAESAAARLAAGTTVVHLNGAFHSDEGLGVVEDLRRRRPEARTLVISIGQGPPASGPALGDFVVWAP